MKTTEVTMARQSVALGGKSGDNQGPIHEIAPQKTGVVDLQNSGPGPSDEDMPWCKMQIF